MNEKVSLTLALSSSALLWTVLYFGSPWAAWSKKPKIFLSPKGLRQKTENFSLLSLSPFGLRKISEKGGRCQTRAGQGLRSHGLIRLQ